MGVVISIAGISYGIRTKMNPLIEYTKWLLKWLGIILLSLVALVAIIGGGAWSWEWWSHDRHAANIKIIVRHKNQRSEPAHVQSSSTVDDTPKTSPCSSDTHPVFVGVLNNSSKTIEYVRIDINAHLPSHSSNELEYNARATSDRIIAPGDGFGQCWTFEFDREYANNPETANAIYEGTLYSVRFKD